MTVLALLVAAVACLLLASAAPAGFPVIVLIVTAVVFVLLACGLALGIFPLKRYRQDS